MKPPDNLSEEEREAWLDGFRHAVDMQLTFLHQYRAALEPGEDDQEAEVCPECGEDLVSELGSEDSFCLECDTTHDN